jgi:hypothetical protein
MYLPQKVDVSQCSTFEKGLATSMLHYGGRSPSEIVFNLESD